MENEALDQVSRTLISHYHTFELCCGAMALFANPDVHDVLKVSKMRTSMFEIAPVQNVMEYLENSETRDMIIENFGKMSLRVFITDTFELVQKFCKETNKVEELRAQSWYQFARIIRNCLSHGRIFTFNDYDRSILPVHFLDSAINIEMDSHPMSLRTFNFNYAIFLFKEMYDFISEIE